MLNMGMHIRSIKVTFTAFLVAVALLAGGCTKQTSHGIWSSSASIVIEPGVSVGPVHSGMTIKQIIAELGQPERTKDSILQYLTLGLYIIPAKVPDKGDVVHIVGVASPFAGHTKEGICLGSGRAEVIQAYGEPTTTKLLKPESAKAGREVLRYERLGLNFELQDGMVVSMGMVFQTPF
jgi:hypothetical protein